MMAALTGKRATSLGLFVLRGGKASGILVAATFPKGTFFGPPSVEVGPSEEPRESATRLMESLGLSDQKKSLRPLDLKLVYYAKEVRHDEHLFTVKAPSGYKVPKGYRWVAPSKAFGSFLLSGHKRGLLKIFPKVFPQGPRALDHVPVEHPSGLVVLCDFDGTVTQTEASLAILRKFVPEKLKKYEGPWMRKEISTHDCLGYQFTMMGISDDVMARFAAENVPLRPWFKEFVRWCAKEGIGLVVTSSGVDLYIRAILKKNKLGKVPFVADRMHWVQGLGPLVEEGFYNIDCDWCGNCKVGLLDLYRDMKKKIVYVGDGETDECPARKADLVVARAHLLKFCKKEGIAECDPFETFVDVRNAIEKRYFKRKN